MLFSKRKINNKDIENDDINNYLIDIDELNVSIENRINQEILYLKVRLNKLLILIYYILVRFIFIKKIHKFKR